MPSTAPLPPDATRARYETLLEVAESIAVHRQLSTLFADLSRLLKRLVPFDFISLTLIDAKERVVRLHILETEQAVHGKPPKSTPFEQTPTIAALQSRRPYYIPDTAAEERFPIVLDLLRANGGPSACILPLFTAQRELGGLHFGSLTKNAYSEEDIEFVGQVARQVAVAVDNALHSEAAVAYEEQLAHERDRLRTLLEVNNAVAGCLETRELFQAISASLRRCFGLDYASLLIHDPDIRALRLHMLDFPDGTGAIREDAIVPLDDSLAGFVFRTRQGRVFSLEEARAVSATTGELFEREGIQSLCCVPLISRDAALGTLNVGSRRPDRFLGDDLGFFNQVAGQVAIALDNALSYKRIEELNVRLEEEKVYLEDEIRTDNRFEEIVGQSRALKATLKQLETVAPTDSTVLIYGETGTGKELLARAIHDLSARKPPSSSSTAPPSPPACWKANFSATRRARSPAPSRSASAASNWRTAAPSSWTRSARSRLSCSPSCCACFSSASSNASGVRARFAPMPAWWRPPIATSGNSSSSACSAPISTTGSTSSP